MCEILLDNKDIDVNIVNKDGNTPLHYLVRHVEDDEVLYRVVRKIIELSANVNSRNKLKEAPLHQACFRGNATVVKILLEANADIETRNR